MSTEVLVKNCSPTLAGIKTGSLFSYRYNDKDQLKQAIIHFNKRLKQKGLRIIPLSYGEKTALIYVYRPKKLQQDFLVEGVSEFLSALGYNPENADKCIVKLTKKIKESQNFPHEIGLFLGYPLEDVVGFIQNRATSFKLVGEWKVYGDEERARKLFARYKKCKEVYVRTLTNGNTIDRLTVSV